MLKNCTTGWKWDKLLLSCMPLSNSTRQSKPTVGPSLTTLVLPPADQTLAAFNPALWIFVLLTTLGSILALALWLVIYRRHTMRCTGEETLITDISTTAHCLPPSDAHRTLQECQHLHAQLRTAPVWHEGGDSDCDRTKHEGRDWSVLNGTAVRQETVPLPATELVTTKTL